MLVLRALFTIVLFSGCFWGIPSAAEEGNRVVKLTHVRVTATTGNNQCLDCHGEKGFAVPKGESGNSPKRALHIQNDILSKSVHGKEPCIACHTDIKQIPHQSNKQHRVDCVSCHAKLIPAPSEVQIQMDLAQTMAGLPMQMPPPTPKLNQEMGHYLDSIHAKTAKPDKGLRPNAYCWECHGKHDVYPSTNKQSKVYRLNTPQTCGGCHQKALKAYTNSIHGAAVKRIGDLKMAVCSDCHSAHKIASPAEDMVKLAITENCGNCHQAELKTYQATYHGQIATLGYAHIAKCHDCHAAHAIVPGNNPLSKTHINNRVQTCQQCHKDATLSFVQFEPHGNTHDYQRFPIMWLAAKSMGALLIGVFLFFWLHSGLWFFREYKEHKAAGLSFSFRQQDEKPKGQHIERFTIGWRLAHLLLALAVMTLVLTGTTVLYADSFWAPVMIKLLGGPQLAAIIHRVAAVIFASLFFGHILFALYKIFFRRTTPFRWFGPESLLPRRQDFHDFAAMMKWFFGKGRQPVFDHWTYWEKFDYWAPFWGMFVIGISGLMLWFATFFGSFLPGWIFNIATIVHGEEAFLAAVFLFSVHFFNCHFRPRKFPLDTVMFTGSIPLEEFKEERQMEYQRLVEDGELERHLMAPPTSKMERYSRILGFVLVAFGLLLLFLVLNGFWQNLF